MLYSYVISNFCLKYEFLMFFLSIKYESWIDRGRDKLIDEYEDFFIFF